MRASNHTIRLVVVPVVAVLCSASLFDRCGPAPGLAPAYQAGSVVADDALAGEWLNMAGFAAKPGKPVKCVFKKDDTVDGVSYLLSFPGGNEAEMKGVEMRMFLFDVGGQRFADVAITAAGKAVNFANNMSLPLHTYLREVKTTGDGLGFEYLSAEWLDEQMKTNPKLVATVQLPHGYSTNKDGSKTVSRDAVISADTAAVQALLQKAMDDDAAWTVGLELVKKGQPTIELKLEDKRVEWGKDGKEGASDTSSVAVVGTKIELDTSPKTGDSSKAWGRVKDLKKLDALFKAAMKAPASKPAKAVPKPKVDVVVRTVCLTVAAKKPKCVERLADDNSGDDLAAMEALRVAAVADVKIPAPPAAPAKPAPAAPAPAPTPPKK